MSGTKITLQQGREHSTCQRDIYDKDEFFYPQYMQVAKCVDEITAQTKEFNSHENNMKRGFDPKHDFMGYSNNIVAFCARRGQGKTSAMLSVARALETLQSDLVDNQKRGFIEEFWNTAHKRSIAVSGAEGDKIGHSSVLSTEYFVLNPIDPSTMEKTDSVLEIIILRMLIEVREYSEKEECKRRSSHLHDTKLEDLWDKFQIVYRRICELKKESRTDEYDDLTNIMETGDSRNTKEAFIDLVNCFLEYLHYDMLVIQVDDADLNPERAYEISEDLRKYCVIPKVMILMAVHLGTLRTCIEQEYVKKYRYLLDTSIDTDHMQKYKCREMAERYVDKFIPDLHQIHLPYIEDRIRDGVRGICLTYQASDGKSDLLYYKDANDDEILYYQDKIARLVYEKTGIILIGKVGYLHNFMPKRMRELSHMLSFLSKLADIKITSEYSLDKLIQWVFFSTEEERNKDKTKYEEYIDRRIRNIEQFETYFFQHWCPILLTQNQCSKIEKIRTVPLSLKNKRTIEVLKEYCRDHSNEFNGTETDFCDTQSTITYADVVETLSMVKKKLETYQKFDFIYAVHMYYTIYMNKILCMSFKESQNHFRDIIFLTQGSLTKMSDTFQKNVLNKDVLKEKERIFLFFLVPYGRDNVVLGDVDDVFGLNFINDSRCQYVRFDPSRFLLYQISDVAFRQAYQEYYNKYIGYMVAALQYICNYDMQYCVRKNINREGKLYQIATSFFEVLGKVRKGWDDTTIARRVGRKTEISEEKKYFHRLPLITENASEEGLLAEFVRMIAENNLDKELNKLT